MTNNFLAVVASISKDEILSTDGVLELYTKVYSKATGWPGLSKEGLMRCAQEDLKHGLSVLQHCIFNPKFYSEAEMLLLALVFRQKRQRGEIQCEDATWPNCLPALHEALSTQEHGYCYYMCGGGLFND